MTRFFDAFISYGRADSKAFATKLHARLLEQGLKVWFDLNDIPFGVDYQNQIDDGIEKAHNFLFIIAPHSVNSPYCRKEIELAIKRNKRIIPLLHVEQISQEIWEQRNLNGKAEDWEVYKAKGLHTSFKNMHPTIGKINWVYFREGQDDFEASFTGLINLFGKHSNYVEQHTRFLVKGLEWERNQKQNSYLLIGEERVEAESWLKVRFKDEQSPCMPTDLHCEFICESTKNANNLLTQVFISHSEKDKAIRDKIGKTLMRQGLTIWSHKTDSNTGVESQDEINQGIEGADNVLYLASADSVLSKYCDRELYYALENNKRILVLLLEKKDLEHLEPKYRALPFIDFIEHEDEEKYRRSADKLIKALNQDAPYYEQHKILLVKALKWRQQNRNQSILLRGYNLRYAKAWLEGAKQRKEHPPLALHEEFITESDNQPADSSLEVFICYSRADSDFARKLNEALQIHGKTAWFDQESIASGTDFQQEICRGIECSDNFLFIISPKSINSPYCATEVEHAHKLNKRFVTVLHKEVSPKELHPALAKVQWIDFNRDGEDFYANFGELVRTLDTDREHVHNHTKWWHRALEWDKKGKNPGWLLGESESAIAQNWLQEAEQQHKHPAATPLQQEFITASRKAIEAARKQEKRQVIILRSLLGWVSAASVAAVGAGIVAFSQYQQAERGQLFALFALSKTAEARFALSRNSLDPLIEALKAGTHLKQAVGVKADPDTQADVLKTLGQAVYWVKERNRLAGHKDIIQSVSFSPDGQMIATASYDKTVKLWNQDGSPIRTLEGLEGHTDAVLSVAFSPDSKSIATTSLDNTVKLWNQQGKVLGTFTGHSDLVYSASFSPDGNTIASASEDNTVMLWNRDGKRLRTLMGHSAPVHSVSFSPDGKTIATASADKTVRLWNRDGKLLHILKGHTRGVTDISFSPDGKTIATASNDKTVKLWSWDGKFLRTLSGHTYEVADVSFSPDGSLIATASNDQTVKLWNRDGQKLNTLEGHSGSVNRLSFSPDGSTLASASDDKTVKLWQLDYTWLTILRGHSGRVYKVSFSPDGKTIATASADKTVKLWNREGKEFATLKGHDGRVYSVRFSPDGQTIASASRDETVKLWNRNGKLLRILKGHRDWVYRVSFSPDGQTIASASLDKTVKLWSRDGKELKALEGHSDGVYGVSFSPDGQVIASASNDSTVKLWSREGKELVTLTGHIGPVYNANFSPDGKTIATVSEDNTVKLWNRNGKAIATLKGHIAAVGDVSFSPDGKTIATASDDKTVKLWNRDGTLITTLIGHKAQVTGVSFSPDAKLLASASWDNSVILWNVENLNLDGFLARGCNWLRDYLKTHPKIEESDLCHKSF